MRLLCYPVSHMHTHTHTQVGLLERWSDSPENLEYNKGAAQWRANGANSCEKHCGIEWLIAFLEVYLTKGNLSTNKSWYCYYSNMMNCGAISAGVHLVFCVWTLYELQKNSKLNTSLALSTASVAWKKISENKCFGLIILLLNNTIIIIIVFFFLSGFFFLLILVLIIIFLCLFFF